jgi:O-acetyl-ADP-ribose deacetylase (regulator of RNase III)
VKEAAQAALAAVAEFLKEEDRAPALVRFVLFDEITFRAYREALEAL